MVWLGCQKRFAGHKRLPLQLRLSSRVLRRHPSLVCERVAHGSFLYLAPQVLPRVKVYQKTSQLTISLAILGRLGKHQPLGAKFWVVLQKLIEK